MPDERGKGPPARRRGAKPSQAGEKRVTSAATRDVQGNEQERAASPNEAAAFDADQLDASIRAREKEDRGEVF